MYKKPFAIPFIGWILIGTIVPGLVIAFYGFTDRSGSFTMDNVTSILAPEHAKALWMSLLLAFISSLICLIISLPLALILRNSKLSSKGFLVFIFILPMWMNFLLRTMAWQVLLERQGVINSVLVSIGLNRQEMMGTPGAVVLGMVYDFLPFMVLPIYNVVSKIDNRLIEAAYDLGAGKFYVFRRVIFPLSIPGIASGVTMVFIPALTTFVISNMLGGGKVNLIGNIIEQEFTVNSNWYLGSGLSLVMMVFIIVSMLIVQKFGDGEEDHLL